MPGLNLKSLLRTAKERQQQERQQHTSSTAAVDGAESTPNLASVEQPPLHFPHQPSSHHSATKQVDSAAAATYVALSLSQPLPPPRLLQSANRVQSSVGSCFYVSEWCDEEAEADMLRCCAACPSECWVQLRGRSLQCWGNTPSAPNSGAVVASSMPAWLGAVMRRVEQSGLFAEATAEQPQLLPRYPSPDHVLINRYEAGQGIMAHKDGPAYQPLVAILSLASHTVMHFYHQPPHSAVLSGAEKGQPALSVLLERRSLLVFTDELYSDYYHCIHEQSDDAIQPHDLHNWQLLAGREQWKGAGDASSTPLRLERTTRYSLTIRASK